jgi:hypothetical protein
MQITTTANPPAGLAAKRTHDMPITARPAGNVQSVTLRSI